MEVALTRPNNRILPSLGIILVAGGFLVLGLLLYLWLKPGPPPYRYQLIEEGGVGKFDKLGLEAWPDLTISKHEVRVPELDDPIAVAYLATRGGGRPVLLSWETRISEPVVFTDNRLSELTELATAITKNVPKDAVVLAWWDISRQVRLLADRETLFTSHLGEPVIAPTQWRGRGDRIKQYEQKFWSAPAPAEESQKFQRFADALAADTTEGAAMLRGLAGPREAYLVVHISDIYKLGLLRPERLDMAYKDFPNDGNAHGLNVELKTWKKENNYEAYALQFFSEKVVRAYFLRDGKSCNILLAQMLPFTCSRPLELQGVQLIYQQGGYRVYKIPPAQPSSG